MRPIDLVASVDGHSAPITHVAFSPGGDRLISSSYDGTAIVWDVLPDGVLTPRARIAHRRLVNAASWSPHHRGVVATASADKTVGLWAISDDGAVAEPVGRLARHTDDVNAVAWLPDGERIVTASEDSTALVWEVRSGRFLGTFAAHAGHCMAIAVSRDGVVLSVGEDGKVFVGGVDRPSSVRSREFSVSIEGCAWAPDGSRIALACDDGMVRVVSPDLDLLDELVVSTSAARSIAYVDDRSGRFVVGSYDATVRCLDGGRVAATAHGGRVWPRAVDTAGALIVVGSFGATPVVLALDGLVVLGDGGPDTTGPNALAHARGSVAIGLDSGAVIDVPTESIAAGRCDGASVTSVSGDPVLSLAPHGTGWLAGTYGGSVVETAHSFDGGAVTGAVDLGSPVTSLAADPTGITVLAGTYGGELARLSLTAGLSCDAKTHAHDGSVKSIVWLDSQRAITGATDCAVRVHGPDGQSTVAWFHGNLVNAVACDGRGIVASASRDRLVRATVALGERPFDLLGGSESMKAVAVLGEGDEVWIIGGSYDFSIYGWAFDRNGGHRPDARAGTVIAEADQAISTIVAIDPRTAVIASWDGTVRTLTLRDGRPVVGPAVRIDDLLAASNDAPQPTVVRGVA